MEEFFERKCCIRGYHIYKEVWEAVVCWRGIGVQERARKLFQLIYCSCGKGRNYHRTFALKAVAGVFAVL